MGKRTPEEAIGPSDANWPAVVSLSLGVFALIGTEILPTSMLTLLAADFGVSEGTAGQLVTATAMSALVTAVLAPSLATRLDRKLVVLACSALLAVSSAAVALAPSFGVALAGRLALGIAVGSFWAMSAAVTVRLVPHAKSPMAMSVVFSGMAVASVAVAPLAAWFSSFAGWRPLFWAAAGLGVLALAFQASTLPALPPTSATRLGTLPRVLARPGIAVAIVAAMALYAAHVGYQTYLRPALEIGLGASPATISVMFAVLGIGGLLGSAASGFFIRRSLRGTLVVGPLAVAIAGLALAAIEPKAGLIAALVFVWGLAYGAVPVAWSLWLTRAVPDHKETASGIFVAAVQVAIAAGAGLGGLVFDARGAAAVFFCGALVIVIAAPAVWRTVADDGVRGHAHPREEARLV
jgi:predicted MFS family arabinose efflux permease